MKFVCDRCQTKYSIADERVRGKVLKVKCKSCANVITVREARAPSSALPTLSSGAVAAHPRSGAQAAVSVPAETPAVDSERTQLAMSPFAPEAEGFPDLLTPSAPPAPVRRPTGSLAAVPAGDDLVQWYMALDGQRTGPFTRTKLVDRLAPLAKTADVHIWNEKLDGWKPPSAVPEVAAEIARRRAPAPPPMPAPRKPTPPPMPPLGGLPTGQPRKPTGPHAPPSPVAHAPVAGSKLPPPGGVHPALAARGAEHGAIGDASSLLETPAPQPHQLPHAPASHVQKTNGVNGHAPPKPVNSDVMQMLNMPGGVQTAPGAPPRLMSSAETVGWTASADTKGRSKTTAMILGLLVVTGLIVVVAAISLKKPPRPAPVAVVKPPVAEPPPPAPEPPPPPVAEPPPPAPEPQVKGKGKHGKPPRATNIGKANTGTSTTPAPGTSTTPAQPQLTGDAARLADNHQMKINGGGVANRPPPAQGDIMKVIGNNRAGIKVCYQRALTRDNSLTHGKLSVKLSIGISGRVKHVALDGPTQFKLLLEPCIKEVVQRWVFPQASEEYGTEFPLVFQGNE